MMQQIIFSVILSALMICPLAAASSQAVVLPLQSETETKADADTVSTKLVAALSSNGAFEIVRGPKDVSCVDTGCAVDIGVKYGVPFVFYGLLIRKDGALYLAVEKISVADRKVAQTEVLPYAAGEIDKVIAEISGRMSGTIVKPKVTAGVMPAAAAAITNITQLEPSVKKNTPLYSGDTWGLGVCIGKGAGLIGAYTYLRPFEYVALEAAGGIRMLSMSAGSVSAVFWPYMLSGKLNVYFSDRQQAAQFGISAGGFLMQDTGAGVDVSAIVKFRLERNFSIDMAVGLGVFAQDYSSILQRYVASQGYMLTSSSVVPIFVTWGIGISFSL